MRLSIIFIYTLRRINRRNFVYINKRYPFLVPLRAEAD